jgi:hypothetical protein
LSKQQHTWDTPAHLVGLPCTIWKRRTGVEMHGTLAQCIARRLGLPPHQQQNCSLSHDAGPGRLGPGSVRASVPVHGLPPQMRPVTPAQLEEMIEKRPLGAPPADPVQVRDGGPIPKVTDG